MNSSKPPCAFSRRGRPATLLPKLMFISSGATNFLMRPSLRSMIWPVRLWRAKAGEPCRRQDLRKRLNGAPERTPTLALHGYKHEWRQSGAGREEQRGRGHWQSALLRQHPGKEQRIPMTFYKRDRLTDAWVEGNHSISPGESIITCHSTAVPLRPRLRDGPERRAWHLKNRRRLRHAPPLPCHRVMPAARPALVWAMDGPHGRIVHQTAPQRA